ncbi:hypothetical protein A4G20_01765 [Pasteurellaceae bacterium RH1A]|nr:hypothetical protein A4G20_01765 [Pasteurellaceae bacterium RH1A]
MIDKQDLSESLIGQIGDVVEGNQAQAKDVKPEACRSELFQADLTVDWHFTSQVHDERIAGGARRDNHFIYIRDFEDKTQIYMEAASYDVSLRQDFLAHLEASGVASLDQSDHPHTIAEFPPFSHPETCSQCSGQGQNRCSSCGGSGKHTCSSCGGSGRQHYSVTTYDNQGRANGTRMDFRSCPNCLGGKTTCYTCSGRGSVRCKPCDGHGYFMLVRSISAVAVPSYQVGVSPSLAQTELQALLNCQGTAFCRHKIYFDQMQGAEAGPDHYQYHYQGEGQVLEQDFRLKGKHYRCYALSNPPYAFVKPPIFDDLFADELAFLQSSVSAKGKINKRQASTFFVRYSQQPALERSMRAIAEARQAQDQVLDEKIMASCQGYISQPMANQLGQYLNKIMDKVSPAYSAGIWWIWGLLASLYALVFAQAKFEATFSSSPIGTILGTFFGVFPWILAGSFFAWILSILVVWIRRQKIPKEYRQNMRHKEPFKQVLKAASLSLILGAAYGYATTQNWLPKWHNAPLNWVSQQLKQTCQFPIIAEHFSQCKPEEKPVVTKGKRAKN